MDYIAELLKNITPEFSRHDTYFLIFTGIIFWLRKERKKRKEMEKKVNEYEKILSKAKDKLWGGIDDMKMQLNGAVGNLKVEVTNLIQSMSENLSIAFDKHDKTLKDIEKQVNDNDKNDSRRDEAIDNLKEDVKELRR